MDKDLATIPGAFFQSEDKGVVHITRAEADYNFLLQVLTGDVADGYKGCPGIGTVKARKALDKAPTWGTVVSIYESAGLTEEDALVQARLARILRTEDYDHENKKPILWSP